MPRQTQRHFSPIYGRIPGETTRVHNGQTSQSCYWKKPTNPTKNLWPHKVFISRMLFVVVGALWLPMVTRLQWESNPALLGSDQQGHLLCHTRDGDPSSNMKMANKSPHRFWERTCSMFQPTLIVICRKLFSIQTGSAHRGLQGDQIPADKAKSFTAVIFCYMSVKIGDKHRPRINKYLPLGCQSQTNDKLIEAKKKRLCVPL